VYGLYLNLDKWVNDNDYNKDGSGGYLLLEQFLPGSILDYQHGSFGKTICNQ